MPEDNISSFHAIEQMIFRSYGGLTKLRLKDHKQMPMPFIQESKMMHDNASFDDMPSEVRRDIRIVAEAMIKYLTGNGYTIKKNNI